MGLTSLRLENREAWSYRWFHSQATDDSTHSHIPQNCSNGVQGASGTRNSHSKTEILKNNSVRSIWTHLTASPCYKHKETRQYHKKTGGNIGALNQFYKMKAPTGNDHLLPCWHPDQLVADVDACLELTCVSNVWWRKRGNQSPPSLRVACHETVSPEQTWSCWVSVQWCNAVQRNIHEVTTPNDSLKRILQNNRVDKVHRIKRTMKTY